VERQPGEREFREDTLETVASDEANLDIVADAGHRLNELGVHYPPHPYKHSVQRA